MSLLRKIFKRKLKSHLLDDRFTVEPAFTHDGVTYYHFPDQFRVPAGRQFQALTYYEELQMRVDKGYLEEFVKAGKKIFSDPKKINIPDLVKMFTFLEERMKLMPMPDYIYRLASVIYFDETESPYDYDFVYNQKKIEKWKEAGDVLDFFLQTPLGDLIRSWGFADANSKMYFPILKKADQIHRSHLSEVLSEKA